MSRLQLAALTENAKADASKFGYDSVKIFSKDAESQTFEGKTFASFASDYGIFRLLALIIDF